MIGNKSLWDSVNEQTQTYPKVVFNINEAQIVVFPNDFVKPKEYGNEDKYCVFEVLHEGQKAVVMTSAYTLLQGLKKNMPLAGKKIQITKKITNGKQYYEVASLS